MQPFLHIFLRALLLFYCSLCVTVNAADEEILSLQRRGYKKGDLVPVSCLNRTTCVSKDFCMDYY
jgi:hypothetical protein